MFKLWGCPGVHVPVVTTLQSLSLEGVAWIVTLKMVVIIRLSALTVHLQEQTQHKQGQHTRRKPRQEPRNEPLQFVRIPRI